MSQSNIDFSVGNWHRAWHRLKLATTLSLILAIGLSIWFARSAFKLSQQLEQEKEKLVQLKRTAIAPVSAKPTPLSKIPATQTASVNMAISQLNLPWRDVFSAIETATPSNIALISLEPDTKSARLKGTAETKNVDDMIAYMEKLKKEEFFSHVQILRHETIELDPNRPVRFHFEVEWVKDVP
ncbi:PilN domain-containing protein [Undibacterium sp. TJN25]|uniref:PilN domain-containing protein n=1 Tax=Undibacterium sp. TJN25 TaxID=3413056 RepID=UPI003BEFE08C